MKSGGYNYPVVNSGGVLATVITSGSSAGGVSSTVTFGGTAQPITGTVNIGNTPVPVTGTVSIGNTAIPVTFPTGSATNTLTGSVFQQTSSFLGATSQIIFASTDLSLWTNVAVTVVNNAATTLQSASLEWSPNNSIFEAWDTTSFAALPTATAKSMQILGNSRKWFRVRGIGTNATGSTDVYVHVNNG